MNGFPFARGLGPRGVTVNAVEPGPTETDITDIEEQRTALRPRMATAWRERAHGREAASVGQAGMRPVAR